MKGGLNVDAEEPVAVEIDAVVQVDEPRKEVLPLQFLPPADPFHEDARELFQRQLAARLRCGRHRAERV